MKSKHILLFLALFSVYWVLAGCSSKLGVRRVSPDEKVVQHNKKAVVFGRIILTEIVRTYRVEGESIPQKPSLKLYQIESEEVSQSLVVEEDGTFYFRVPRGNYIISEIAQDFPDVWGYIIHPEVTFTMPLEGTAFYIGTLEVQVKIRGGTDKREISEIGHIEILDDFTMEKQFFMDRNPSLASSEIRNTLMTKIPDRSPTLEYTSSLEDKKREKIHRIARGTIAGAGTCAEILSPCLSFWEAFFGR